MTSNPITITMDEPQLAAYRESAKSELSSYRSATDYRAAQQTELADAITAGTAAIDAAETPEAVTAALNAAKAAIDQIKTDAQLTEEEQGNLSAKPDPDQDTNTDTKPETDPDTDTESETSIPFTDVLADSWYEEPVGWAVANQITKGTSLTLFSPQKNCTRGEIVTFLWRMAGEPEPTIENPFADLTDESAYYYKAAIWAYENSITLGTSTTNLVFAPGDLCSRAQFVTLLWRIDQEPKVKTNFQFTDVEEGSYYYDAVLWAFTTEITKGTSMTQFSPSKTCTRAEAVTFLYRYAND
jgi:type II secretory pathway pseudopilin PulG